MAHNIVNEMIAFNGANGQPWHGIGQDIQDIINNDSLSQLEKNTLLLKAAKMDWRVERRMLAMRGSDGTGLVVNTLENFRAIVRADTDEVFQVATSRYHPLQNDEVINFFAEYCEAGHASMETVGALGGGAKIWALAKLNSGTTTSIDGVDPLRGYLMLATSHDGSLRTIAKATQVRVVCWNTLSAAIATKSVHEFRVKHSRKWTTEVAEQAKKTIGMAVEQITLTNEVSAKLAHVAIDDAGRLEFVRRLIGGESILEQVISGPSNAGLLDSVLAHHDNAGKPTEELNRLGKGILEAIMQSPGSDIVYANGSMAKDTLWGAVNGATYHVDHERGRAADTRLQAAWFGVGDTLKTKAMQVAVDMAGITV